MELESKWSKSILLHNYKFIFQLSCHLMLCRFLLGQYVTLKNIDFFVIFALVLFKKVNFEIVFMSLEIGDNSFLSL